ncbi:MAG: hypothetical protein B1H11_07370 [Desulfobacteraceae bacterium 4484_190.1]|nr:MAG: hypothetical protein B1H11_07370 [Desulfobacteraceae bacterium 4484_190.1]
MVLISAEKSGCIFIPVGARDILSASVCAQAGLNPVMPVQERLSLKNRNRGKMPFLVVFF